MMPVSRLTPRPATGEISRAFKTVRTECSLSDKDTDVEDRSYGCFLFG